MKAVVASVLLLLASAALAPNAGAGWRFLNDTDALGGVTNLGSAPVLTLWPSAVHWGLDPPELKIYPDGVVQRSGGEFEPASANLPADVVRSWISKIVNSGVVDLTGERLRSLEKRAREKYPRQATPRHQRVPADPWNVDLGRWRSSSSGAWILEILIVLEGQGPVHRVVAYPHVMSLSEEHPEIAEFRALADVLRPLIKMFNDERFRPDD